jgi:hypothetical protein
MPDFKPTRKGWLFSTGHSTWLNGSRNDKASKAAAAAQEFIDSGEEISNRIARDGPWPTALRLTKPFTEGRRT